MIFYLYIEKLLKLFSISLTPIQIQLALIVMFNLDPTLAAQPLNRSNQPNSAPMGLYYFKPIQP